MHSHIYYSEHKTGGNNGASLVNGYGLIPYFAALYMIETRASLVQWLFTKPKTTSSHRNNIVKRRVSFHLNRYLGILCSFFLRFSLNTNTIIYPSWAPNLITSLLRLDNVSVRISLWPLSHLCMHMHTECV